MRTELCQREYAGIQSKAKYTGKERTTGPAHHSGCSGCVIGARCALRWWWRNDARRVNRRQQGVDGDGCLVEVGVPLLPLRRRSETRQFTGLSVAKLANTGAPASTDTANMSRMESNYRATD